MDLRYLSDDFREFLTFLNETGLSICSWPATPWFTTDHSPMDAPSWYCWMMNWLERITVNPLVMSGKPCVRGMRVTVANVLRLLASGHTSQRILAAYPDLEPADIDACLLYASMRVEDEELASVPT